MKGVGTEEIVDLDLRVFEARESSIQLYFYLLDINKCYRNSKQTKSECDIGSWDFSVPCFETWMCCLETGLGEEAGAVFCFPCK